MSVGQCVIVLVTMAVLWFLLKHIGRLPVVLRCNTPYAPTLGGHLRATVHSSEVQLNARHAKSVFFCWRVKWLS